MLIITTRLNQDTLVERIESKSELERCRETRNIVRSLIFLSRISELRQLADRLRTRMISGIDYDIVVRIFHFQTNITVSVSIGFSILAICSPRVIILIQLNSLQSRSGEQVLSAFSHFLVERKVEDILCCFYQEFCIQLFCGQPFNNFRSKWLNRLRRRATSRHCFRCR